MTKEIWHVVVMNYQKEILSITSFGSLDAAGVYLAGALCNHDLVQLFSGNYECQCSHGI
jgi:hypothetical protein